MRVVVSARGPPLNLHAVRIRYDDHVCHADEQPRPDHAGNVEKGPFETRWILYGRDLAIENEVAVVGDEGPSLHHSSGRGASELDETMLRRPR